MFCPSCGAEYTIELKYCNRCGANLSGAMTAQPDSASLDVTKAVAAVGTTMAVVTLGGFIVLMVGAIKLAEKTSFGTDPIMFTVLLGMIIILTADIFHGIQLSRLIKGFAVSQLAWTNETTFFVARVADPNNCSSDAGSQRH